MTNEADLQAHYERTLSYYSPLKAFPLPKMLDMLGLELPDRVLDVGCGSGYVAGGLPAGVRVTGFDYAASRVARAQHEFPGHEWFVSSWQDWFAGDVGGWPLVVAVEVLEHVDDWRGLLAAMRGAGDLVVATVPINLPYHAHLTDWFTVQAAVADLEPDDYVELRHGQTHVLMAWQQTLDA